MSACIHIRPIEKEASLPPKKIFFSLLPCGSLSPPYPVTLEQSRVLCRGRCPPAWVNQESTV